MSWEIPKIRRYDAQRNDEKPYTLQASVSVLKVKLHDSAVQLKRLNKNVLFGRISRRTTFLWHGRIIRFGHFMGQYQKYLTINSLKCQTGTFGLNSTIQDLRRSRKPLNFIKVVFEKHKSSRFLISGFVFELFRECHCCNCVKGSKIKV